MHRLPEGLILQVRQQEIVWKYIIWTYSETEEADLWQSRQSRSVFTSLGMKADLKCETTDLMQSRQKGSAEAELPIFANEGRSEMWNYRSFAVKAEGKCSQGRREVRRRNFPYLAMKADLKCETADLLQSRQKGSAEAELPIFGHEGRVLVRSLSSDLWQSRLNESAEAKLKIFGSPGRDEMRKRNFRSSGFICAMQNV